MKINMIFTYLTIGGYLLFILLSILLCIKVERFNTLISSDAIQIKEWIKNNYYWSTYYVIEQSIENEKNLIPSGLVIGKYFIAIVIPTQVNNNFNCEIIWDFWLLYKWNRPYIKKNVHKEQMTLLKKVRPHLGCMYEELKVNCVILEDPFFTPIEKVAKEILNFADRSSNSYNIYNAITLITGPTGKGKSFITKYIARLLNYNAVFVEDFDPTAPAQSIELILKEAKPTIDRKLIVVMSEVDKIIERFHTGKVQIHQNFSVQVRDKDTWNILLDYLTTIDNCIVIMTTNKPYSYFETLDSSYLRKGRIHLGYNFGGEQSYYNNFIKNIELNNIAQIALDKRLSVIV